MEACPREGRGAVKQSIGNPWKADAAHLDRGSSTGALSPSLYTRYLMIIFKRNNILLSI